MAFSFIFSINENVIQVYNNEDIELFYQNLVNIALISGWYIGQAKRHYLILEIAIMGPKGHLLFITFSDPHSMIGISEIELGETSSLVKLI